MAAWQHSLGTAAALAAQGEAGCTATLPKASAHTGPHRTLPRSCVVWGACGWEGSSCASMWRGKGLYCRLRGFPAAPSQGDPHLQHNTDTLLHARQAAASTDGTNTNTSFLNLNANFKSNLLICYSCSQHSANAFLLICPWHASLCN